MDNIPLPLALHFGISENPSAPFLSLRNPLDQIKMNLPIELMNHILSYRPCHPIAVLMKQKIKIYYEKDIDYYEQFDKQFIYKTFLVHEVKSFRIFVHKVKSFQEWYFPSITNKLHSA